MATFHLQIVTPDRMVYDGQAERVIVRTLRGDVCILARHIDYAAPLGIGEARVTDAEGATRVAACSGGMIGVDGGEVRIMATTFEWADDIDLERAQRAQKEALERLDPSSSRIATFPLLKPSSSVLWHVFMPRNRPITKTTAGGIQTPPAVVFPCPAYLVPNRRSPASPRPGTIYPCSLSFSSHAAT